MLRPAAVLWDLDGTLVDSEPDWIAAEHELCDLHGVIWTHEDSMALVGSALPHAGAVLRDSGVPLEADEIVDFLISRVIAALDRAVPWQPGAVELLETLRVTGVPCALVTMSYSVIAERIVAATPDGTFAAVVTGDSVTHGKPHPEPYLMAADLLGVDVTACVAVEDSLTGLASATASGAHVIGVQRAVPIPSVEGRSRIASLLELDVDALGRIASGDALDLLEV
jgi:HAD superfamily hydrolase (TIGR01509 family)